MIFLFFFSPNRVDQIGKWENLINYTHRVIVCDRNTLSGLWLEAQGETP